MSRPRRPLRRSMPSSQRKKAEVLLGLAACNVAPGLGKSWKQQLYGEFEKPYFVELLGFVALERKHHKVYPPPEQVFTWTQMGDIRDVGQEPYHGPKSSSQALLQCPKSSSTSASLENIFKELSTDIDVFVHPSQKKICQGGSDKESSSSPPSSLSGHTKSIPIRREAGSSSRTQSCTG